VPVTRTEIEAALARHDPRLLVFEAADVIERVRRVGDPLAAAAANDRTVSLGS